MFQKIKYTVTCTKVLGKKFSFLNQKKANLEEDIQNQDIVNLEIIQDLLTIKVIRYQALLDIRNNNQLEHNK